jgi:hypothetical protein
MSKPDDLEEIMSLGAYQKKMSMLKKLMSLVL